MTLRARLLLLVVVAVLPAIGIEIDDEIELRAARQQETHETALRLMHLLIAEQIRIGEGTRQLLVAFSEASGIRTGHLETCSETAVHIRAQLEGYTSLGLVDAQGRIICSSLDPDASLPDVPSEFAQLIRSEEPLLVGTFRFGDISGKPVIAYGIPVKDDQGTPTAVAWAALDLTWLSHHYADRFNSQNMTLLMADRNGTILLRLPDPEEWIGKPIGNGWSHFVNATEEGVVELSGVDGVDRVVAFSPATMDPKGLYIGVGLSKTAAFAAIDRATRRKAALISLGFLATLLGAWFGGETFIRKPINVLLDATRRWRQGDYSARARLPGGNSEISRLGQAFDEMAEALERREKDRQAAESALAKLNAELENRVQEEVTGRETAQSALLQSQKIEAIGQLTSGVAHDFNNLLAAVLGNLELLRPRLVEPRAAQLAEGAMRAAARGAKLTEQLLSFSRRRHMQPAAFDLNRLVTGMGELLVRTIGPSIQISRSLGGDLWPALSDPSQIEIALLNLVLNARDAMPQGGSLLIQTTNLRAGDRRIPREFSGDFVMLTVRDSGSGMLPEVKERAFEPFFTTKDVGKGTGLGLSMIYGIAAQSNGWASIESEPGRGTAVSIVLPRARPDLDRPAGSAGDWTETAAVDGVRPARTANGQRILVVDDDPDVRELTRGALMDRGYVTIEFGTGGAVLEFLEDGGAAQLLIVDYAMPGLRGDEVARRVRAKFPTLPIVMITGFADPDAVTGLPEAVQLVRKPFRIAELMAAVERGLGP